MRAVRWGTCRRGSGRSWRTGAAGCRNRRDRRSRLPENRRTSNCARRTRRDPRVRPVPAADRIAARIEPRQRTRQRRCGRGRRRRALRSRAGATLKSAARAEAQALVLTQAIVATIHRAGIPIVAVGISLTRLLTRAVVELAGSCRLARTVVRVRRAVTPAHGGEHFRAHLRLVHTRPTRLAACRDRALAELVHSAIAIRLTGGRWPGGRRRGGGTGWARGGAADRRAELIGNVARHGRRA